MKILHTADWHLGNKMHEIDRTNEFDVFLKWTKEIIQKKEIETLIISGDIFDVANPATEARKLYYSFLASLLETSCKNVIIIAGNHDSANMLEASKEILEYLNIHIIGSVNNLCYEEMVFELYDKEKNICGICCAIPFVREIEIRHLNENYNDALKILYDGVLEIAKKNRGEKNIPIIATGHLYATDLEGRLANTKKTKHTDDGTKILDVVGKLGNVSANVFSDEYDYVALGHIHYTTRVAKKNHILYSGSPFILGFDECTVPHHVLSVEINKQKELFKIEKIETPYTNLYKRIEGNVKEIKNELQKIQNENIQKNVYIELCYEKKMGLNIQEELNEPIKALNKNINIVSWKRKDTNTNSENIFEDYNMEEIKNLSDEEIFTRLILQKENLEENSEEAKKILNKYLPIFLKLSQEIEE